MFHIVARQTAPSLVLLWAALAVACGVHGEANPAAAAAPVPAVPTLYVWMAGPGDVLPEAEPAFDERA